MMAMMMASCGPKMIPGIGIELRDTPDHRALLEMMESYRQAFESRDVGALVSLASTRYYENSGSTETDDDYSYEGLNKYFTEHFKNIEKCTLDYSLREVRVEDNKASISFRFTARYLMKLPSGPKWRVFEDINQMNLVKEQDHWKVVSGM